MNKRSYNQNKRATRTPLIKIISANIALCLAGISLLILLFYSASATLLTNINYMALALNLVPVLIFLAVLFFAQKIHPQSDFQQFVLTGLGLLYFAFLIHLLAHIFDHADNIKNLIQVLLSASGLLLLIFGFKHWSAYHQRLIQQLAESEQHDQLTTLYNRREFLRLAELEFERAKRYDRNLAFVFIDIDHFRKVNDSYGYSVGDEVLRLLTAKVKSMLRESDLFCRWDGEEFVLIAPELDLSQCEKMAEKIRVAAETLVIGQKTDQQDLVEISVTISLGCAILAPQDESVLTIIERADEAMYQAKASGRNQVCSRTP